MAKRTKSEERDYSAELENSHERWAHIYEFGSSDPFYEDGTGLNLVRNHIHYYRGKIEETMKPEDYPEIYYKEIPPEVNRLYMARPDEIRAAAKVSLAVYKAHPDYQYIIKRQNDFTPKTKKNLCVDTVIGYAKGLEQAIAEDNLVSMRRHEKHEHYLESFVNLAQKIRALPAEQMQLSLFSLTDDESPEPEYDDFCEEDTAETYSMTMM